MECVIGDIEVLKGDWGDVVCGVFGWLAAVGWFGELGGAGLPFVLNRFLLMSLSCLSCCVRRYWGVVGVEGVGA